MITAFLQSKLIYFPSSDYSATPADFGLEFEDLTLTTSDSVRIAAWYVPHAQALGTVLFAHGNAGNISDRLHSIAAFHRLRMNVLIFDYRGFGRSEGSPTEKGTYADADAAWMYLTKTRNQPPSTIVFFGRSLGGAVMIDLASRHAPAGLIVENTFTSLLDVGRLHYPLLPVGLLLTYRYDSIEKVGRITCPKLFLHGLDDTLIPLDNGRALFDAAAEPKAFVETPGDHNEAGFLYASEFIAKVDAFLRDVLRPLHGNAGINTSQRPV